MAQIVLIDIETYRPGLNNIGDVVSVHDDDVLLGPSYAGFSVVEVPGTAQEVVDLINAKMPERKRVFRSKAGAGEWTDERPEEAEVWNDGGEWKRIEARPKYMANLALTQATADAMKGEGLAVILSGSTTANLTTKAENQTSVSIAKIAVEEVAEEAKA